jgi:Glycosyl hydrolase catalytic core
MVTEDLRQIGGRLHAVLALVAAGVLLAALSAAAAPAAAAPVPPEFFGMSAVDAKNKDFPRMARGGIGTYRTVIPWIERGSRSTRALPLPDLPITPDDPGEETDPDDPASPGEPDGSGGSGGSGDPGGPGPSSPYDWNYADTGIRKTAASGIEPLAVLYGSPPSVARNPRTPPLGSEQARQGWQGFVRAAVARYGPNGEFWRLHPTLPYKPVRVWQVWNEQNARFFWHGSKPSPSRYAELLRLTHDAISEVDPAAEVVLGGMYGYPNGRGSLKAKKFLRGLYRTGSQDLFDGVAVHPYSRSIRAVKRQITDARKIMNGNGEAAKGIWITEIGWSTAGPRKWQLVTSRKGQARKLRRAFRMLIRRRSAYGIRNVTWFSWRDFKDKVCRWCGASGLFNRAGKPKPAWFEYARLAGGRP